MQEKTRALGVVTIEVNGPSGELIQKQSNIITATGLGYIADLLSNAPTKPKFTTASSYIVVGTGYTGINNSAQTWVKTASGSPAPMQVGYPQPQGAFPNSTVVFSSLFSAGTLNASNLNEACLVNSPISGSGISLAYAQINPPVSITSVDSLTITWSISFTAV